jgi:hypothetical protein
MKTIEWILWSVNSLCGVVLVLTALTKKERGKILFVGCALAVTSIVSMYVEFSKFHLLWMAFLISLFVPWIYDYITFKIKDYKSEQELKKSNEGISESINKLIDAHIKEQDAMNEWQNFLSLTKYKSRLDSVEDKENIDRHLIFISNDLMEIEKWIMTTNAESKMVLTESWRSINDKLRNLEYLENYLDLIMIGENRNQKKEARSLTNKNHKLKELVLALRTYQEAQRNLRIVKGVELQFQR